MTRQPLGRPPASAPARRPSSPPRRSTSAPGAGCPNDSKIGELTIESPLVEGQIEGSMFFATPRENRFGTLLALYMVAKAPDRGHPRQGRRQGRLRPGHRTADHDLRRPAPAALLALQRPLPRRPAQPARDPVGLRRLRHRSRRRAPGSNPNIVLHQSSPFTLIGRDRRRPLPARRARPLRSRGRVGGTAQRQRLLLHALLPAPDPHRRRTGDHLLLGDPAARPARQNRRRPLLPGGRHRGGQSARPAPNRPPNPPARRPA